MSHNYRGHRAAEDEEVRKFDPEIHAVTVQQALQRLVHDGMVFHASGKMTGIADEASVEMLFSVPAGVSTHLHNVILALGGGDVDLVAFEGTTTTAKGTPMGIQNLNRTSAKTPALGIYSSPTITADGDLIYTEWAPPTQVGVGQSITGIVNIAQGNEWALKPDTDYLLRITNNSGSEIDMSYRIMFYEPSYDD